MQLTWQLEPVSIVVDAVAILTAASEKPRFLANSRVIASVFEEGEERIFEIRNVGASFRHGTAVVASCFNVVHFNARL